MTSRKAGGLTVTPSKSPSSSPWVKRLQQRRVSVQRFVIAMNRRVDGPVPARGNLVADKTYSCYEAGREGFWLHRFLQAQGITNHVVDSSAIEVNRRQRRAKSDGLDVRKLLSTLIRYAHGARDVWRVVPVPTVEAEDHRHLHRDLETLKQERASTTTRLKGLLNSQGICLTSLSKLPEQLEALRLWEGSSIPSGLCRRLLRVYAHHEFLSQQIAELEAERRTLLHSLQEASVEKMRQLMSLKGIGINGAWLLVMAFLGWS